MHTIADPFKDLGTLEQQLADQRAAHFEQLHRQICREKLVFRSRAKAAAYTISIQSRFNPANGEHREKPIRLYPYKCSCCPGWHLTSRKKQTA